MMTNAPLTQTMTPEVCARIIDTMNPRVHEKIVAAFNNALVTRNLDLLAADGTSPAGEHVMNGFNTDMERMRWAADTRRMMRMNIRAYGLTLVYAARDAAN